MDNNNLTEILNKYNKYQKGDESCKMELILRDETITGFHFDKSELGGSVFSGVKFKICQFSDVYLNNSNFGGSTFEKSLINTATMRKAAWNDINASSLTVQKLDSFRSDFINSKFENCILGNSRFFKSNFGGSVFNNVTFYNSHFELASFTECNFYSTLFKNCTFKDCHFEPNTKGIMMIGCRDI